MSAAATGGDAKSSVAAAAAADQKKIRASAEKRLMRDYRELMTDPIPGIACEPIAIAVDATDATDATDTAASGSGGALNLFEWHGNLSPLSGVYRGTYFHIIMIFTSDYPKSPPEVRLCTTIQRTSLHAHALRRLTSDTPHADDQPQRVVWCVLCSAHVVLPDPNVFGAIGTENPYICLDMLKVISVTTPCMYIYLFCGVVGCVCLCSASAQPIL